MLEDISRTECLENALTLKERLATAKDPAQVMYIIYDALSNIEQFDEMTALEAEIDLDAEDSIQKIRAAVMRIFENNVLPKQYAAWFEGAKKECELEMKELTDVLDLIKHDPLKDENDYMNMLLMISKTRENGHSEYRMSQPERDHDDTEGHILPIRPEKLGPWRDSEIQRIMERMTAVALQQKRIEEHAPIATPAQ